MKEFSPEHTSEIAGPWFQLLNDLKHIDQRIEQKMSDGKGSWLAILMNEIGGLVMLKDFPDFPIVVGGEAKATELRKRIDEVYTRAETLRDEAILKGVPEVSDEVKKEIYGMLDGIVHCCD